MLKNVVSFLLGVGILSVVLITNAHSAPAIDEARPDKYFHIWVSAPLKVEKNGGDEGIRVDVPYQYYGWNIYRNGEDLTMVFSQPERWAALDGQMVIAKLDVGEESAYRILKEHPAWFLGRSWESVKKKKEFTDQWSLTKEAALSTEEGPYTGAYKNELVAPCLWETADDVLSSTEISSDIIIKVEADLAAVADAEDMAP